MSKNGIQAAMLLIFIPSFGEFVIPSLFGGAKEMYIGNFVGFIFLTAKNWPMGSAFSVLLVALCIMALLFARKKQLDLQNTFTFKG